MKMVQDWIGRIVSATDDAGNRFDGRTGRIDLADGRHTILNLEDRKALAFSIASVVEAQKPDAIELGAMTKFIMRSNMPADVPSNIIALAGDGNLTHKNWKQHLSKTETHKLVKSLEETLDVAVKVDDRTGAKCYATAFAGIDLSLIEQTRALFGNATRFLCHKENGAEYIVDTVSEPSAKPHLVPASKAHNVKPGPERA